MSATVGGILLAVIEGVSVVTTRWSAEKQMRQPLPPQEALQ